MRREQQQKRDLNKFLEDEAKINEVEWRKWPHRIFGEGAVINEEINLLSKTLEMLQIVKGRVIWGQKEREF